MKHTFTKGLLVGMLMLALVVPAVPAHRAEAQTTTTAQLQAQIAALLAQIQQLQAQLGSGGSTSAAGVCPYTWTRNLNVGSTGTDVLKLQQFLNADPETRVAATGVGSTGQETQYYGPLTAAAVSKFQMKHRSEVLSPLGLVSPTGYFGASSRAQANTLCVSAPVTPPADTGNDDVNDDDDANDDSGTLRGGESSLEDFDLRAGDDTNLEEGQRNAPVANIRFDVEDGDIRISRIDLVFEPNTGNGEDDPWDTFTDVSLYVSGTKVADMKTNSRGAWSEDTPQNGQHRVRFTGLDLVFREGTRAEIGVRVSVAGSVRGTDDGETWEIFVPDQGIRGRDGAGVDQTIGDETDNVSFDIEREGTDDELKVRDSDKDPKAATLELKDNGKSDWKTIFAFKLDTDDSPNDIEIESLRVDFTLSSSTFNTIVDDLELRVDGQTFDDWSVVGGNSTSAQVTFDFDNNEFVIDNGDAVDVEVRVRFNALASANEGVTIEAFTSAANVSAEGADDLTASQKSGSATSDTHTLRTEGVSLDLKDSTRREIQDPNVTSGNYGEFRLQIELTAVGDTIYIPETASRGASTTAGIAYQVENANGTVITTGSTTDSFTRRSGGTRDGNFVRINEGQTATFELLVTFDPVASGQYRVQILGTGFNTAKSLPNDTQSANPASDFETGNLFINN